MHVTLPLRTGETTVNLKRPRQPHKTISRPKAIKDVTLLELLDEDRIQILVIEPARNICQTEQNSRA